MFAVHKVEETEFCSDDCQKLKSVGGTGWAGLWKARVRMMMFRSLFMLQLSLKLLLFVLDSHYKRSSKGNSFVR